MQRWHSERDLMLRRWRLEVAKHEMLPTEALAVVPPVGDACHCYRGMGTMRKRTPYDCGNPRCTCCHFGKWDPKGRANKRRAAIERDLVASGIHMRL